MVGGTAALPQARGMDGEEPEDEEAAEVYVGHRKTKRRKHNDKVGGGVALWDMHVKFAGCSKPS